MFSITFKRPLVTLAVVSGLLVAAAPASAEVQSPKDQLSGIHLRYFGQGSDGNHRAVSDGTSNTLIIGEVAAPPPAGSAFVVDGPLTVKPARQLVPADVVRPTTSTAAAATRARETQNIASDGLGASSPYCLPVGDGPNVIASGTVKPARDSSEAPRGCDAAGKDAWYFSSPAVDTQNP